MARLLWKGGHMAPQQAETPPLAFIAAFKQQLQAKANAQQSPTSTIPLLQAFG
jgi:hypothetical protein